MLMTLVFALLLLIMQKTSKDCIWDYLGVCYGMFICEPMSFLAAIEHLYCFVLLLLRPPLLSMGPKRGQAICHVANRRVQRTTGDPVQALRLPCSAFGATWRTETGGNDQIDLQHRDVQSVALPTFIHTLFISVLRSTL